MQKFLLIILFGIYSISSIAQDTDPDCTNEACVSIYKNQYVLNYVAEERGAEQFNTIGDIPVYFSFTTQCPTFLCQIINGATKLENLFNKIKVPSHLLFHIEFVATANEIYSANIRLEQSSSVIAQARFNQDTLNYKIDSINYHYLGNLNASLSQVEQATAETLAEMLQVLDQLVREPSSNIDQIIDDKILDYVSVTFEPHATQQFGFDSMKYAAHNSNYDKIIYNQRIYNQSWKAMPTGGQDKVVAKVNISNNEYSMDSVFFRSVTGNVARNYFVDDEVPKYFVEPVALGEGDENFVEAFYRTTDTAGNRKEVQVGKLKLSTYNPQTNQLFIVPVNGTTIDYSDAVIKSKLNSIYNQAVINWNVETLAGIQINDWSNNHQFNDSTSGLLSNYTDDMKQVIETLDAAGNIDNDAFYIFLVKNPKSGNKVGYMPKKRRFGFLFMDNIPTENDFYVTLAHELGHGAFRLQHTFEGYPQLTQGTTDNLMDYSNNTYLHKYQWDFIHDPAAMIPWFQEDEGAAMVMSDTATIGNWAEIFPECDNSSLLIISRIYDTVGLNFDKFYDTTKNYNINLELNKNDLANWSIRKSSHIGEGKVRNVAKAIASSKNPNYITVDENEIYIENYEYNVSIDSTQITSNTKIALYSYEDHINFSKPCISDFNKLREIDTIKIATFKFRSNTLSESYIAPITWDGTTSDDPK